MDTTKERIIMPVPDPTDRAAIEAAVKEFVGSRDLTGEVHDPDTGETWDLSDFDFWIDEFMSSYIIPRAVAADAPDTDFEGIDTVAREILAEMIHAEKTARRRMTN
jgi:hypothetical protein